MQDREGGLDLAEGQRLHALHGRAVDGHAGRTVTGVEEKLDEGTAERVPHDDRLAAERVDDLREVTEDFAHAQAGQR
ncbi:hypothetical protein GCM10015535_37680 [Streptomyces gelaticus]|uniref:Uncharacterized protein n=1 Tax=Streptomyces gelaticus TaxID=285446 RepID=A0ABQ2W3A4_9ACTN|nr:hypothetical protein GCM10015535_37680 [Streptomyces gelaticus]